MQLAVNLNGCARAARTIDRADDIERARIAEQESRQYQEEMRKQYSEHMRGMAMQARLNEIRQQQVTLGIPQMPSPGVATHAPVQSARAQTVPVTIDLQPPDMRRGESLDPSPLNVMVDNTIMGTTRAGEMVVYQLLPGTHTIAITTSENVPLVGRTIKAVLGEPQSVRFSE